MIYKNKINVAKQKIQDGGLIQDGYENMNFCEKKSAILFFGHFEFFRKKKIILKKMNNSPNFNNLEVILKNN
jgi:hypothetical protein